MWHLYELVISNSRVWLKVQASCESTEQAGAFFEARFTGTSHTVDDRLSVTSFKLGDRSQYVANWVSIVGGLPAGWDDDEFQIEGSPYPWCETLSDDCDCHGAKGSLDAVYCSDFGLHDETDKRASKCQNVRYLNYIQTMEDTIARRDESQREERLQREQRLPPRGGAPIAAKPAEEGGDRRRVTVALADAINGVDRLVAGDSIARSMDAITPTASRPYEKRWRALPQLARKCRLGVRQTAR